MRLIVLLGFCLPLELGVLFVCGHILWEHYR